MLPWNVIELRLVHTITMVSLCDFRGNIISSNVAKPTGSKTSLLTCSHRAEGHTLLTPGCTSLVVIRHAVGRFSYSPQAGHLSSSFGTWWEDSLTHPMLDISSPRSACGGETLLLAPGWTCLVVLQHMVGRFSYSPQAGHLSSLFIA